MDQPSLRRPTRKTASRRATTRHGFWLSVPLAGNRTCRAWDRQSAAWLRDNRNALER
jgi:hypothetical protein